jgi:hypothetical protein
MPGWRLNVRVFDPPRKVDVAPTTAPEEDATVMLWLSGAMLVKAMENLPALAVSEVLLYFSWPSGLASRLSACPALGAPLDGAGVEDLAGVDLVGGAGRAFGLDTRGLGAGVEDVAELDVVGVAGWLADVDAESLGAGVDAVAVLDVVGVEATLAGVDAGELVLLDEPQPASASRPTARASVESLDTERRLCLLCCLESHWSAP